MPTPPSRQKKGSTHNKRKKDKRTAKRKTRRNRQHGLWVSIKTSFDSLWKWADDNERVSRFYKRAVTIAEFIHFLFTIGKG